MDGNVSKASADLVLPAVTAKGYATFTAPDTPKLLLQSTILALGERTLDGSVVKAVQLPWYEIIRRIKSDPGFLDHFAEYHREFEEFIAGLYKDDGYDVILTPQSGDRGRDIIATKPGFCCVKILGQAKAHRLDRAVTHKDVQAMIGAITMDPTASKGMVVTTSHFAPGVQNDPDILRLTPSRLELIDGAHLLNWLNLIEVTP